MILGWSGGCVELGGLRVEVSTVSSSVSWFRGSPGENLPSTSRIEVNVSSWVDAINIIEPVLTLKESLALRPWGVH